MRKSLLSLTLAALLLGHGTAVQAAPDDRLTGFTVVDNGSESVTLFFLDNPQIVIEGTELVATAGSSTYRFALADVTLQPSYTPVTDGIKQVATDGLQGSEASISLNDGDALIQGLKAGAAVAIYDTTGKLLSKTAADSNGAAALSLNSLPKGIYILKTPAKSIKFAKK